MRKILFRGKAEESGLWLYGDLRQWSDDRKGIYSYKIHRTRGVIPETVGQYTGLTDKNGTRIFEGDIVRHHNGDPDAAVEKGKVYWDERSCGWRRTSNGAFHHGVVDTYKMSHECVYEVIGNIHDNPELLGGGEDA